MGGENVLEMGSPMEGKQFEDHYGEASLTLDYGNKVENYTLLYLILRCFCHMYHILNLFRQTNSKIIEVKMVTAPDLETNSYFIYCIQKGLHQLINEKSKNAKRSYYHDNKSYLSV